MSGNDQANAGESLADKAGPHQARTKENSTGIDDIGLPSGIQPGELTKPDEVKPDPAKVKNKS
jgi:hypothetical protein